MPEAMPTAMMVGGSLAGQGVAALSKTNRAYRKAIRGEIDKLESGNLGMTEAEKRTVVADANRGAVANQAVQNAALTSMVAQNPAMAGKALQAQGQIAQAGAAESAKAGAYAAAASQDLAQRRKEAIMALLQQRSQQNIQYGQQAGQDIGYVAPAVAEKFSTKGVAST